jgi:hypothetical protein
VKSLRAAGDLDGGHKSALVHPGQGVVLFEKGKLSGSAGDGPVPRKRWPKHKAGSGPSLHQHRRHNLRLIAYDFRIAAGNLQAGCNGYRIVRGL